MISPVQQLFDSAMRCTKCNAKMGECACWVGCPCGWTFAAGEACKNPIHGYDMGQALDGLGVGQTALARLMGTGDRTVRRWFAEPSTVPENVRRMLDFFMIHPKAWVAYQRMVNQKYPPKRDKE